MATEIATGRRLASQALRLNPNLANAMLTTAALDVVEASAATDPGRRRRLVASCLSLLDRASAANQMISRDAEQIADRARALVNESGS